MDFARDIPKETKQEVKERLVIPELLQRAAATKDEVIDFHSDTSVAEWRLVMEGRQAVLLRNRTLAALETGDNKRKRSLDVFHVDRKKQRRENREEPLFLAPVDEELDDEDAVGSDDMGFDDEDAVGSDAMGFDDEDAMGSDDDGEYIPTDEDEMDIE